MTAAHRNPNTSPRPYRFSNDASRPSDATKPDETVAVRAGRENKFAPGEAIRDDLPQALPLPLAAHDALEIIEEAGGEAWCVGGFVRDALLGRPIHDVDIATSLPWPAVQEAFRDAGWGTVETGVAHGTLTVVRDGEPLEITTYRTDGTYSDGRHPDSVTQASSIEEDLKRRDFTINALAYHPARGIIDPFGGVADMERGVLRSVGDPTTRFSEDALRILRACRFASQLGVAIDPATFEAMIACKNLLRQVSGERVYRELERFVCGDYVHDALMACVDVLAFAVGPAMGHDVAHGFQCGQACIISLRESADTAHGEASLQSYKKVRFIITNGADGGTPPAKSADFPTSPRGARRRLCDACYTAGKESLAR